MYVYSGVDVVAPPQVMYHILASASVLDTRAISESEETGSITRGNGMKLSYLVRESSPSSMR